MPSITLNNLSVGYLRGRRSPISVLTHINATLQSGRLTCLVGANGIGKSTLLRTLAAFQPPLAGQMFYHQDDNHAPTSLTSLSQTQLARVISVVLTTKTSVENLTVQQVVALGRSPYTNIWGTLRAHDHRKVQWAMHAVGITALQNRMVQTLSDGERQKMMIAKALAQDTPVMLLDEPTAFLDYKSKVEMMTLLSALAHETNKMVLLSTHDLEQAVHTADALWVVTKGQVQHSNPQDTTTNHTNHLAHLQVLEKRCLTNQLGQQHMAFCTEGQDESPEQAQLTLASTTDYRQRTQALLQLLGEELAAVNDL
ncbi:ABC transporter ATP-binding protein [Hoylesella shahii]|uniref:ABC transporter ATP-binding protein n=1 Tax=Hoylesella shahii TaxID=228603 RepID=UPI0028ED3596|nr:ABC transporter ATP-binding protein [Hoylesella shahii]